jgi:hypothetical protein
MTDQITKQGPIFLSWQKASDRGRCDCCGDNPEPTSEADYSVALIRFGETVVAMCGTCLRRLKNQLRRAEG